MLNDKMNEIVIALYLIMLLIKYNNSMQTIFCYCDGMPTIGWNLSSARAHYHCELFTKRSKSKDNSSAHQHRPQV